MINSPAPQTVRRIHTGGDRLYASLSDANLYLSLQACRSARLFAALQREQRIRRMADAQRRAFGERV
jgi:hypothetical protein